MKTYFNFYKSDKKEANWNSLFIAGKKIITSVFLCLFFSQLSFSQVDLTKCYGSCTSGDFTITKAYLSDINGNAITSAACNTPGATVTAYLSFIFTNNTSSDRNGIFISGTLNGNYIFKCFPGVLPKKKSTTFTDNTHTVNWVCGTDLTLTGTFISWGSAGEQVCDITCSQATPSKCRTVGDVVIQTPLSNNFSFSGRCETGKSVQTIDFTGSAVGGDHNYTYKWDFGDGSAFGTVLSPSHSYATANTYSVTFTVTDGTGTSKSVTKSVTVATCCTTPTITTNPSAQTKCDGSSASFTAASTGGIPAPTVQWQLSTDGTNFTNLTNVAPYSGVTTTTLSISSVTVAMNGYKYRCVFTSGACTPATTTAALLTVNGIPAAPGVSVVNNCDGSSDLTATNFTGSLLWSNNATTTSIHVTNAATYTVTQTVSGCTSGSGSGTSAPRTTPTAPGVNVVNNCDGSSDLTATGFTGTLLWSNNATTTSIHVTNSTPTTYTVTQTVSGCTSAAGSGTTAPKTTPSAPSVSYVAPLCTENTFSVNVTSVIANATYSIVDKNGNAITGVLPSGSYTPTTNSNFSFTKIPAGSGFQVTVTNNGCPSSVSGCGNNSNARQTLTTKSATLPVQTITLEEPLTKVTAAPNPFDNRIRFSLQSAVSGQGSLELYDMLGQKVKTVFQGYVQKGQIKTIEYSVPGAQHSNLIYLFKVGTQRKTGILIGVK